MLLTLLLIVNERDNDSVRDGRTDTDPMAVLEIVVETEVVCEFDVV